MSFITRWFRRPQEEDYETVLQNLTLSIQRRQSQLSEIRTRERRATLLVTLYALGAWLLYVGVWYIGFLDDKARRYRGGASVTRKALITAPLVLGPVIILFTRRIVQTWYTMKGNAEEKTLRLLIKEQRSKVEEVKKKTNYYSTRNLLEKYDDGEASLLRRRVFNGVPQTPSSSASVPSTPRPSSHQQDSRKPLKPPKRQWFDRFADAVLGSEDEPVPGANRYALICEKCFTHCGLADPDKWQDTQFYCPKCNHFNASVRSRQQNPPQTPSPARNLSPPSHPSSSFPPTTPEKVTPTQGDEKKGGTDAKEREDMGEGHSMEVDDS